jgi:hypothetical protein
MGVKNYVVGRIDQYVVTGYGTHGSIADGSKLLMDKEGKLITLDCDYVELLLIFGPDKTIPEIDGTVEILRQGGFQLQKLDCLMLCDNKDLRKIRPVLK